MIPIRLILILACTVLGAAERSVVFPACAGAVDARAHGAKGDGRSDDSAALNKALAAAAGGVVWLPDGTYLVKNRIEWPEAARFKPLTLQGQSATGTIIRLADKASGYQDPRKPRAVVWTQEMHSADNFRNQIRDLTVDSGSGNPGAVGIQFMANNMGALSRVRIRSGDGGGVCGLDLAYNRLNGPLLVHELEVSGFAVGIRAGGACHSQTLSRIRLTGQREAGIENDGQVLSIEGLVSANRGPAVVNRKGGVLTLVGAELTGGEAGGAAIRNQACCFLRAVTAAGYAAALADEGGGPGTPGLRLDEYASHGVQASRSGPARSLALTIEAPPGIPWEADPAQWADVRAFGATGDGAADDGPALQRALDSGASTVVLPYGSYKVGSTVRIAGAVRRIVGMESTIQHADCEGPALALVDAPGAPEAVEVEFLAFTPTTARTAIDNAGSRTLALSHCKAVGGTHTGKGRIFLTDVGSGVKKNLVFGPGQRVWIRQVSNEPRDGLTHLINNGAQVWVLGHKSEMPGVICLTRGGGSTEILGSFLYWGIGGDCAGTPMWQVEDGRFSGTFGAAHFSKKSRYEVVLEDAKGRRIPAAELPERAGARMASLVVAR